MEAFPGPYSQLRWPPSLRPLPVEKKQRFRAIPRDARGAHRPMRQRGATPSNSPRKRRLSSEPGAQCPSLPEQPEPMKRIVHLRQGPPGRYFPAGGRATQRAQSKQRPFGSRSILLPSPRETPRLGVESALSREWTAQQRFQLEKPPNRNQTRGLLALALADRLPLQVLYAVPNAQILQQVPQTTIP